MEAGNVVDVQGRCTVLEHGLPGLEAQDLRGQHDQSVYQDEYAELLGAEHPGHQHDREQR